MSRAGESRKSCGCYIVDKVTGRIVSEHESVSDAAEKMGRHRLCHGQVRKKALFVRTRYTIRLVDDYDPHESFDGQRIGVPIVVSRDGDLRVFCNRHDAADFLHVELATVSGHVASGRPTSDGWTIRKLPRMGALNVILGLEEA